jgi:ubiquinone/menaquinone biosynthesis C-methylase UbiE
MGEIFRLVQEAELMRNFQMTSIQAPEDYLEVKGVDRRLSYSLIRNSYTVCDIGGGSGIDAFNMAKLAGLCICLDLYMDNLKEGVTNKSNRSVINIEFIRGDCEHIPLRSDSVDFITCFSVLDHLPGNKPAVQLAISEFARILKESCFVVITLPNKIFLPGTLSMRIKSIAREDHFYEQRYSPKELHRFLTIAKLRPLYFDSNYPTRIGITILRQNLPPFVRRIPANWVLLLIAEKIFRYLQKSPLLLLFGARFGYLSQKIPKQK